MLEGQTKYVTKMFAGLKSESAKMEAIKKYPNAVDWIGMEAI